MTMTMDNDLTLSPIRHAAEGGFEWTVLDPSHSEEPRRYRTNDVGRGLWEGDRQILGTTQLDLNCSPGARRRRVLAFLEA